MRHTLEPNGTITTDILACPGETVIQWSNRPDKITIPGTWRVTWDGSRIGLHDPMPEKLTWWTLTDKKIDTKEGILALCQLGKNDPTIQDTSLYVLCVSYLYADDTIKDLKEKIKSLEDKIVISNNSVAFWREQCNVRERRLQELEKVISSNIEERLLRLDKAVFGI